MSVAHFIPGLDVERGPDGDGDFPRHARARVGGSRRLAREGHARSAGVFDPQQFMWLLVDNLNELNGYARRLTGRTAEAHDLVQETCRRAIESRLRFTVGSDMRAWLCCIMRNLYRDRIRRSARDATAASRVGAGTQRR